MKKLGQETQQLRGYIPRLWLGHVPLHQLFLPLNGLARTGARRFFEAWYVRLGMLLVESGKYKWD